MLSFIKVTIGFRLNTRIHSAARTAESVVHQSALISISTDPREMDLQVNIYINRISISVEYISTINGPKGNGPSGKLNIYINRISISMEYILTINGPEGNGPSCEPIAYV